MIICENCGLKSEEGIDHCCEGTLFDRVRRRAELLARKKAKQDGRVVGKDDWRQFELPVLYEMLEPNRRAGEMSPDNTFSVDDLVQLEAA